MRTHIELDEHLLAQVQNLGCFATKKAAVNTALAEYTKLLKRRQLLELRGKVSWEGDLDKLRTSRNPELTGYASAEADRLAQVITNNEPKRSALQKFWTLSIGRLNWITWITAKRLPFTGVADPKAIPFAPPSIA